jgi:hypothetical protein
MVADAARWRAARTARIRRDDASDSTKPTYAVSVVRPLARRRRMIARPARVRIRARKPCLRFRRRLFGWYVRFMLVLECHQSAGGDRS